MKRYLLIITVALLCVGCGSKQKGYDSAADTIAIEPCPVFMADSALQSIYDQCDFGPRVPGTEAHRRCGDYLVQKFRSYGCKVTEQEAELTLYDGTKFPARNIIASTLPECVDRIMICAHWDSRPWADRDPDEGNHKKPVPAANDGASGVAVMLEMARLLQISPLRYGVDFICFDAEDMGMPYWDEEKYADVSDTWCLGSTYWALHPHCEGYTARYGVLLDMVGGRGSRFFMEGVSRYYANTVVQMLWQLANQIGYASFFPLQDGGQVQDDHVPVNQYAGIPCIDVIPHFEYGPSSFGPTWHTLADVPDNIDPVVLKAVGQSVMQMMYNDNPK